MTPAFRPSREELTKRYYELCDKRDQTYKAQEPLEQQLTELQVKIEALKKEETNLVNQIDHIIGDPVGWLELKKEIADIARFLVRIPKRNVIEVSK